MIFSPCCDIWQLISNWMTWIPLTHGGFNLVKIGDFLKEVKYFYYSTISFSREIYELLFHLKKTYSNLDIFVPHIVETWPDYGGKHFYMKSIQFHYFSIISSSNKVWPSINDLSKLNHLYTCIKNFKWNWLTGSENDEIMQKFTTINDYNW